MEGTLYLLFQITLAASLLIAILLILRRIFMGRVRPTWQYAAWILVLIRLLIPLNISSPASVMNLVGPSPVATVESHASDSPAVSPPFSETQTYPGQSSNPAVQVTGQDNVHSSIEKKPGLLPMLFILWISGALVVLAYMAGLNMAFLRRLRQSSVKLAFDQIPFYRDLCLQVRIKTPLPVVISHHLPSPCLVGLFRPYIAITPEAAADKTLLRHVLLHELCHFKQQDNLISLLRNICCALYWFNPLVWAAALVSRDDSELSCDARVLRYLDEKEGLEYGHTILTLLNTCSQKAAVLHAATAMTTGKSSVRTRIDLIINRPQTLKAVSVLAVGLAVLLGVMTLTGAQAEPGLDQRNPEATVPGVGDSSPTLSDEAGAKRSLDMESLRLLAHSELTFKDIINGYEADKVVQDDSYSYTAWQYILDNGFSFDLRCIQEKNLPDRYTASLSHNESNYIFFPCRPESLERFLAACAQGNEYNLKTYESFDGKKIAEIEYDETRQQETHLKVLDDGRTYTLSQGGSLGRVCWSPDSVYGAVINMTTLDGTARGDNCAYLYDSKNHQFYNVVDPKTIISAFNKRGTFDNEITSIYLRPRIQWSPDSKKLLLSCYPAINDNQIVALVVYNVAENTVEDIVMKEIPKTLDEALSWEW